MKSHVLLVDDVPEVARGMARHLGDEFEIELAYSGPEALLAMENTHFDVVVTSLNMPKATGWEFTILASRMWPETAFVVLSGNVTIRERKAEHDAVVSSILPIPTSIDQVRQAIRQACGRDLPVESQSIALS